MWHSSQLDYATHGMWKQTTTMNIGEEDAHPLETHASRKMSATLKHCWNGINWRTLPSFTLWIFQLHRLCLTSKLWVWIQGAINFAFVARELDCIRQSFSAAILKKSKIRQVSIHYKNRAKRRQLHKKLGSYLKQRIHCVSIRKY